MMNTYCCYQDLSTNILSTTLYEADEIRLYLDLLGNIEGTVIIPHAVIAGLYRYSLGQHDLPIGYSAYIIGRRVHCPKSCLT